jgi:hypothetical protein
MGRRVGASFSLLPFLVGIVTDKENLNSLDGYLLSERGDTCLPIPAEPLCAANSICKAFTSTVVCVLLFLPLSLLAVLTRRESRQRMPEWLLLLQRSLHRAVR